MDRKGINYIYFGVCFFLLVLMAASGIFVKENLSGSRIFFFLYATGQAGLETSFLIFLGIIIRRFIGEKTFLFFIGATFLLLLLHGIDFLLDRVLDLSVWETFDFILDEDFTNFIFLLDASGVSLWIWFLGFGILAALPLAGIFLYLLSEKITDKRPIVFLPERFLMIFFCLPAGLFFWDFSASRIIHPDAYTDFLQSLPWKFTFLEPKAVSFPLLGRLLSPIDEKTAAAAIENNRTVLEKKPNIYLFIIESLRRDILTAETAPHLSAFGKNESAFDFTFSSANGTMLSWFSIFHSQFSHCWDLYKKAKWEMGSPPLQLLKKWGYKIRVYSSAQLGYYGMDQLLFGKETRLIDSYQTFHHAPPMNAADSDIEALSKLQKDLAENPLLEEGQVFIIFWDATHFDYSWPKSWTPKFVPFSNEFAYFKAFYSDKNIELIKNRYRNSVHFIDSLFGNFLEHLPRKEEAIVIAMGDHGEEFFEHGHLFHNSHLAQEQIVIPLFMKFGTRPLPEKRRIVSQIDIFPSLIDHLSGQVPSLLQGQSIFREEKWPYAVVARFNASRSPYEFCIHNGEHKLIARFADRRDPFKSGALQIRSLRSGDDRPLPFAHEDLESWIEREFGEALDRLFPRNQESP